jgi:molybdopterin-guanine dinucleotide biosynthesis protein
MTNTEAKAKIPTTIPGATEYVAEWRIAGRSDRYRSRVVLIEGYSTEADVPKILAIAHLGDRDLADLILVDQLIPEAA